MIRGTWTRTIAMLVLVAMLAMALAACGEETTSTAVSSTTVPAATTAAATTPAGDATTPAGETTKVSLALDWYPWGNHTGIFMAIEKGYFADEGLDVDVQVPADPTTALQLVASGRDDLTISYQADLLYARAQGLEVQSVAALVQHPLNTIMALESSGITTPTDLKGKKVGATGVPSDEAMLKVILEDSGLTLDDVEVINVGFDLMPALIAGSVDAIIGGYFVHESILAKLEGHPVVAMNVDDWGVPDYYELLLVAGDQFVADHPDVLEKFLRALGKGYADAAADPAAAIDALMKAYPETNEEVEREGIGLIIPFWTDNGAVAWGTQTEARWQEYHDWLREVGLLEKDVPVTEAFTNSFIERATP